MTITNMIVSIKKVNKTKVKLESLVIEILSIKMKGKAFKSTNKTKTKKEEKKKMCRELNNMGETSGSHVKIHFKMSTVTSSLFKIFYNLLSDMNLQQKETQGANVWILQWTV